MRSVGRAHGLPINPKKKKKSDKLLDVDGLTRLFLIQNAEEAAELKKKRQFRKFSYRGIDLDAYVNPRDVQPVA